VALAANKTIIFAPAMNEKMWENSATKNNITTLQEAGNIMIEPLTDVLACGEEGMGKMQEPAFIASYVEEYFNNKNKLRGKKILLTAGGTREYIDPVRFIGNDSSGLQAIEIAKSLNEMGADVEIIAANIFMKIPLPKNKITRVKSADEMFEAVKNKIAKSHVFIGCAAVSDYKVKNPSNKKIKKDSVAKLTLELEQNPDILDFVSHAPNRPALVIGFAAEGENILENAKKKLAKKNCDLIIANDIENGAIFGALNSKAYLVEKNNIENLGRISKKELARNIAKNISEKLKSTDSK